MTLSFHQILTMAVLLALPAIALAQVRDPQSVYAENCANCHGTDYQGSMGTSLVKGPWKHGNSEAELFYSIKKSYPKTDMPAWEGVLTDDEIRALVAFLKEKAKTDGDRPEKNKAVKAGSPAAQKADSGVNHTELHDFRLETYVDGLKEPWSMAFLPDGGAIITERLGGLRLVDKNGVLLPDPVKNVPDHETVDGNGGQAGLFDVKLHPDFASNGLIYLSFADRQTAPAGFKVNMTRVIRAKLENNTLVDIKDIFVAPFRDFGTNGNFGGRMALDGKGFLYFSIGDRGQRQTADSQNLKLANGKIHRVKDDGTIPPDNPFVGTPDAMASIWAYGVRNSQGLCIDPATGDLWETEHGMKGGDELNLIRKGVNYGWPLVTRGTDYGGKAPNGTLAGQHYEAVRQKDGMEEPAWDWTPSIAVCGINFYTGDVFPKWKGSLFVASLASSQLHRLEIKDNKVVHDEIVLKGAGRLRYVITGPDGVLYVLRPDRISRVVPAK